MNYHTEAVLHYVHKFNNSFLYNLFYQFKGYSQT